MAYSSHLLGFPQSSPRSLGSRKIITPASERRTSVRRSHQGSCDTARRKSDQIASQSRAPLAPVTSKGDSISSWSMTTAPTLFLTSRQPAPAKRSLNSTGGNFMRTPSPSRSLQRMLSGSAPSLGSVSPISLPIGANTYPLGDRGYTDEWNGS